MKTKDTARKTIQIKIAKDVHKALRIRAFEEGKTLARVLAEALERYALAQGVVRP